MEPNYSSDILKPNFKFIGTEKSFESQIFSNIHEIAENCGWPPVKSAERQYLLRTGSSKSILDILIFHIDGSKTIIEVKGDKNCSSSHWSGIGQILYYGKIVGSVTGVLPRMVFASPVIHDEMVSLIKYFQLPIDALMIDNDRAIYVK